MKEAYKSLYKELIEAYYNRNFEERFNKALKDEFASPEEAKEVLSILSGVEPTDELDDYKFTQNLIHRITQGQVRSKIIHKVNHCQEDCEQVEGKSKCQSVCPFDAIMKDKEGDKWIDEELCMSCGKCVAVCDKGNYMDVPQGFSVLETLMTKDKVYAIVAPAIAGQFGPDVTLDMLREAFIKIGFKDMVEVAVAADVLSIKEALEFNDHVHKKDEFMITSCCCPMWVAALRKVYSELVPDVSPSVSPMIAMGRMLKALDHEAKVVFIGPCIAKKAEAKEKDLVGDVDFVLTFEELKLIFEALNVELSTLEGVPSVDYASTGGRLYARTGGVSQAVWDIVDQLLPQKRELFSAMQVDGMKDCKELLSKLQAGEVRASFIEGMGCPGGCVGGPKKLIPKEEGRLAVDEVANDSAVKVPFHSEVLLRLLKELGITNVEELRAKSSIFERSFE